MGNPFQDQLLKAGLVNKKQLKKAKHDQRVNTSQKKKKKKDVETGPSTLQRQQAAEKKRIQELNQQQRAKQQQKETLAQIKQLIDQNRMKQDPRGEAYNFVHGVKIKRIYVSSDIAEQISCGQAGIVEYGTGYEVVLRKIAKQVRQRNKETVIVLYDGKPEAY